MKICEFITVYIVSTLHVSSTDCGHLQGGAFRMINYKEH
jgi:hypothetical protein